MAPKQENPKNSPRDPPVADIIAFVPMSDECILFFNLLVGTGISGIEHRCVLSLTIGSSH